MKHTPINTSIINNEVRIRIESGTLNPKAKLDLDNVILPPNYVPKALETISQSLTLCPVNYEPAQKVAIALSGGMDSSTCLYASCKAVGNQKTIAVIVRHEYMTQGELEDKKHAQIALDDLGVDCHEVNITKILNILWSELEYEKDPVLKEILKAEALPRARALAMNNAVSRYNWITIDTANFTEICFANMTKGDYCGNVDIINDLLKCEVRTLGKIIGVHPELLNQEKRISEFSSTFNKMFGADYNFLDPLVHLYLCGNSANKTAEKLGHNLSWVQAIYNRFKQSKFIDSRPISYIADIIKHGSSHAEDWVETKVRGWQENVSKYSLVRDLQKCRIEYMPISE